MTVPSIKHLAGLCAMIPTLELLSTTPSIASTLILGSILGRKALGGCPGLGVVLVSGGGSDRATLWGINCLADLPDLCPHCAQEFTLAISTRCFLREHQNYLSI